jgi:hypothetical protein
VFQHQCHDTDGATPMLHHACHSIVVATIFQGSTEMGGAVPERLTHIDDMALNDMALMLHH